MTFIGFFSKTSELNRIKYLIAGNYFTLAVLDFLQFLEEIEETGFGYNFIASKNAHLEQSGAWLVGSRKLTSNNLIFVNLPVSKRNAETKEIEINSFLKKGRFLLTTIHSQKHMIIHTRLIHTYSRFH